AGRPGEARRGGGGRAREAEASPPCEPAASQRSFAPSSVARVGPFYPITPLADSGAPSSYGRLRHGWELHDRDCPQAGSGSTTSCVTTPFEVHLPGRPNIPRCGGRNESPLPTLLTRRDQRPWRIDAMIFWTEVWYFVQVVAKDGDDMREREPMTQTIKASQARQEFSQLLNKVFRRETRVIVEKSGIPVAAIISAEDLEHFTRLEAERQARFKVIDEIHARNWDKDPDEVERDVAQEIAAMRAEERQR